MKNNEVNKLDMKSKDIISGNVEKIQELFPNVVKEGKIDFNALKQELSNDLIDEKKEKYQLTWVGKNNSILEANRKTEKTLRPIKNKSIDFEKTKNVYIEGDNLETLKILLESYLNKVGLIYIDPPYNTGNDFIYNDNFSKKEKDELIESGQMDKEGNLLITKDINSISNGKFHSAWLSLIYPRLKVARDLLKNDGIIFISIDNNEINNLKNLCDLVFGYNNFITILAVENNPKGRKNNIFVAESYEYCLIYAKNKQYIHNNLKNEKKFFNGLESEKNDGRNVLVDEYGEFKQSKRQVIGVNKSNELCKNAKSERRFVIYYSDKENKIMLLDEYNVEKNEWIISEEGTRLLNDGYIRYCGYNSQTNEPSIPLYSKETIIKLFNEHKLFFKENGTIYEKERNDEQQITSLLTNKKYGLDLMTESATSKMEKLFGIKNIFNNSKSVDFIKALIKLYPSKDETIMDFFSGSATTAEAIYRLNTEDDGKRKFVLVQIPEKCDEKSEAYKAGYRTICDIGEERIRRAGKKIKEETNADIDYGFRVYKVDSSNMKDVYYEPSKLNQTQLNMFESNIKEDRTAEDLLTQVILDLGLTLDLRIEEKNILNNKVYFVAENSLVACFDNQINIDMLNQICEIKPLKVVFRESSFRNDSDKINAYERIKKLSPETEISVI